MDDDGKYYFYYQDLMDFDNTRRVAMMVDLNRDMTAEFKDVAVNYELLNKLCGIPNLVIDDLVDKHEDDTITEDQLIELLNGGGFHAVS